MKYFTALLAALLFTASLSAETFKKGEKVAQVGIGYGHSGIYGNMGFPPITLGFQYGLEDKISIGGLVSFSSSSQDYFWGQWSYSYITIGARGEYHFLENVDKLDGYAGLTLGYDIVSSSWKENPNYLGYNYYLNYSASGSYLLFGIHGGVRYYFTPQISVFGELGFGVSYLSVGVAFKL